MGNINVVPPILTIARATSDADGVEGSDVTAVVGVVETDVGRELADA